MFPVDPGELAFVHSNIYCSNLLCIPDVLQVSCPDVCQSFLDAADSRERIPFMCQKLQGLKIRRIRLTASSAALQVHRHSVIVMHPGHYLIISQYATSKGCRVGLASCTAHPTVPTTVNICTSGLLVRLGWEQAHQIKESIVLEPSVSSHTPQQLVRLNLHQCCPHPFSFTVSPANGNTAGRV